MSKVILIEGNRDAFISKASVDKFKSDARSDNFDIKNAKQYFKSTYKIVENYNNTNEAKFTIIPDEKKMGKKVVQVKQINERHDELLEKLHNKRQSTHVVKKLHTRNGDKLMDDINDEYNNLVKMTKMPVPSPDDILKNPEQYKNVINMVLKNSLSGKLGKKHPFIKYFTLLSEKMAELGIIAAPDGPDAEMLENLTNSIQTHVTSPQAALNLVNKMEDYRLDKEDSERNQSNNHSPNNQTANNQTANNHSPNKEQQSEPSNIYEVRGKQINNDDTDTEDEE